VKPNQREALRRQEGSLRRASPQIGALQPSLKEQLRTDGMQGGRRSDAEAKAFFDQRVNAEAKGSIEGIQAVVGDPCGRARVNCRG